MAQTAVTAPHRPEKGFGLVRDTGRRTRAHNAHGKSESRRAARDERRTQAYTAAVDYFEKMPKFDLRIETDCRAIITLSNFGGDRLKALKTAMLRMLNKRFAHAGTTLTVTGRNREKMELGVIAAHRLIKDIRGGGDGTAVDIADVTSLSMVT